MSEIGPNQIDVNGKIYNISQIFYNGTVFDTTACTVETCSILVGTYTYLPSIPANAFFAAIFGLLFVINVLLAIYYHTWGILVATAWGYGLEVGAYITRIIIHNNDFTRLPLVTHLYCVALGPTFLCAAIYLCLGRIVIVYGESHSRFKPRTYSVGFLSGDFIALALQAAGGGMVQADGFEDIGLHTLIAGLGFQVLSLTVFAAVCADFSWRLHRAQLELNPSFAVLRQSSRWRGFLVATAVLTVSIYVRSIYRVIELQAGFHSHLFNDQLLLMLFEGSMITIGGVTFTIFHPGLVFRGKWREANFPLKG